MILKNKWQPKKYGRPAKVISVAKADWNRYVVEIEQQVFSRQQAGIIGRYYIEADDEMDAYMKASRGEFNVY